MCLEVAGGFALELPFEAASLLGRIVQLAERVGDFETTDVELEAFDGVRIVGPLFREWRHLRREIVDERRLDERLLVQPLEDLRRDLSGSPRRLQLDVQLARDGRRGIA